MCQSVELASVFQTALLNFKDEKTFTLLALTIGFSMNAQMDDNSANNNSAGTYAVAMGVGTAASGTASAAMEETQQQVDILLQQWGLSHQQVILPL